MKCIYCQTDSKHQERSSGKCPKCGKKFAFEPRNGDPFTDPAFKAAVDAVSADGKLRWGVEHLHYELAHRLWKGRSRVPAILGIGGATVATGVIAAAAGLAIHPVFWILAWGGASAVWVVNAKSPEVRLDKSTFDRLWSRWTAAHGLPPGVIVRQPAPKRLTAPEPDIGDYSFDRAVICDRARTVDLLIANNFHFENNCAVLSIGGYPEGPFETVRAMLKRNRKLKVFALHDATVPGCQLAYHLANDPAWFSGQVSVIDVGLRPRHAGPFNGRLLPSASRHVFPTQGITAAEAAWLAKYSLELAAIRPEQIIKRLFRAVNKKEKSITVRTDRDRMIDHDDLDHHRVELDSDSFGSDAHAVDGSADSFG